MMLEQAEPSRQSKYLWVNLSYSLGDHKRWEGSKTKIKDIELSVNERASTKAPESLGPLVGSREYLLSLDYDDYIQFHDFVLFVTI